MATTLFHLAFPVTDIAQARAFYADGLGCGVGRANDRSLILNLYGHQLVAHLTEEAIAPQVGIYPRHFGLVFESEADYDAFLDHLTQRGIPFHISPKCRFAGSLLEHRTFFLQDPFHNLMEFKYYRHPEAIFGAADLAQVGET
ncbi:MAG: VOC family protein [Synechococcales bacterium]|nr:VOC family protein [Synechococcales bacterium]